MIRSICRDFNSIYSSLFPKLGRDTRVFKILFSKPFWISEIFHHSHKGLSSALGSSGDDVVLIMNFAPFDIYQTGHWQEGIEEEEPVTPSWHGYGIVEMGGESPEGRQSAGDPVGPVPQSLREPPRDSSPRDHSWPQMGDLSSSTIKPHHYPWLCLHRPWNSYHTAALL